MKYTVKLMQQIGLDLPYIHLQFEVNAPSAEEAIRAGYRKATKIGYPGPFRNAESESVEDPHDVWKAAW